MQNCDKQCKCCENNANNCENNAIFVKQIEKL